MSAIWTFIKRWFTQIDFSKYTLKQSNYLHLPLEEKIAQINKVALTDEKLINKPLTAYNAIKQDYTKYGYDKTEWEELVKVVKKAKNDLRLLQFENASLAVKNIQKEIDKLNPVFAASRLQELRALREKLDTISVEEQSLLDLTNYNALMESYSKYIETLEKEVAPVTNAVNNSIIKVQALSSLIVFVALSVLRKRWYL